MAEEFDYSALESAVADPEVAPVTDVPTIPYAAGEENPFRKFFEEQTAIHKWNGLVPETFGYQIKEAFISRKQSRNGSYQLYFKGTSYYESTRRNEIIYPFSSMLTQLFQMVGYSKEDARKLSKSQLTEEHGALFIGKFISIKYGGKMDIPGTKNGEKFHSAFIQEMSV